MFSQRFIRSKVNKCLKKSINTFTFNTISIEELIRVLSLKSASILKIIDFFIKENSNLPNKYKYNLDSVYYKF